MNSTENFKTSLDFTVLETLGWTRSGPPWTRSGPPWTRSGPPWTRSGPTLNSRLDQI